MKILGALAAVLAVLVLAVLAVAYGGFVDVSALGAEAAPVEWFLETTRHRSIERAIDGLEVPPLDDPGTLRTGLVHYHRMCVTCHGAPGVGATEFARGLNPMPPELAASDEGEEITETFWIVKNGLKMTGMPAFGPTHSDDDLWAIAAFVGRLPDLTAEEYASMVQNARASLEGRGGHSHDASRAEAEGVAAPEAPHPTDRDGGPGQSAGDGPPQTHPEPGSGSDG